MTIEVHYPTNSSIVSAILNSNIQNIHLVAFNKKRSLVRYIPGSGGICDAAATGSFGVCLSLRNNFLQSFGTKILDRNEIISGGGAPIFLQKHSLPTRLLTS